MIHGHGPGRDGLNARYPANRASFGLAGTANDSPPFPALRSLPVTDASTRATLAVSPGPAGAGHNRLS